MNNRHKYFRNLRYKQKLEAQYDNRRGWSSNVFFITKELDPRTVRESNNFYLSFPDVDPVEWEKATGRDYYRCWKRPEVPYSIIEYQFGRKGWKKVMKWQSSRHNRRIKIDEDSAAPRAKSYYKKVEDIWYYD